MQRSSLVLAAVLGLALAGSVQAQDLVGGITDQLRDLGFEQIDVKQTLLGRTRIIARSAEGQREIILNPNTGEILRDFWQAAPGKSSTSRLVDNRNSSGNSGEDDSDNAGSDGGGEDNSGSDSRSDNRSGSDDNGGSSGSDDSDSDDNDDSDDSSDGSDKSGGGDSGDSDDD